MRAVVPDDCPEVLRPSPPFARLQSRIPVTHHASLPGPELAARIADAEVVVNIRSSTRFDEALLRASPALRLISIWGTGTDNVDLAAARALGIRVTNTPAVSAPSIAEHALALMLAVARRIPRIDAEVRSGHWPRARTTQLAGKTLGIIGLGAIGRRFAELGLGIGMNVIAWTLHPRAGSIAMVPLDELLARSDVVSLHLRLSEETRGFLGRERFARMKRGAIFINTARGPIADEAAMVEALTNGHLAGAGLDVFEREPLPPGHPLTKLENVVLSPHSAGVTPEALEAGLALAVDNVLAFLDGRAQNVVA